MHFSFRQQSLWFVNSRWGSPLTVRTLGHSYFGSILISCRTLTLCLCILQIKFPSSSYNLHRLQQRKHCIFIIFKFSTLSKQTPLLDIYLSVAMGKHAIGQSDILLPVDTATHEFLCRFSDELEPRTQTRSHKPHLENGLRFIFLQNSDS